MAEKLLTNKDRLWLPAGRTIDPYSLELSVMPPNSCGFFRSAAIRFRICGIEGLRLLPRMITPAGPAHTPPN